MEFILSLGKAILYVPVWAFVQTPLLRWSTRLNNIATLSFRAAFTLGLITGAASLIVSLALLPLYNLTSEPVADNVVLAAMVAVTAWGYGYFLRGNTGNSIGMWKGFKVFVLTAVLLLAIMLAVAVIAVFVGRALP